MNATMTGVPSQFPPLWACGYGEDEFGLFAECELGEDAVVFRWRWIPPGVFVMGSPDDEELGYDFERPQHEVTLSEGFWIAETPVTQSQWLALEDENPSQNQESQLLPVENVTWEEALEFVRRLNEEFADLGANLPSEAQWEYACRAGTTSGFNDGSECAEPYGKDPALEELGWFIGNSESKTQVVGQKAPNQWGLFDSHGNVWEWCLDVWSEYTPEPALDPLQTSLETKSSRVIRGGCAWFSARYCRSAIRSPGGPGNRSGNQGFRLVAGQSGEPEAQNPFGTE